MSYVLECLTLTSILNFPRENSLNSLRKSQRVSPSVNHLPAFQLCCQASLFLSHFLLLLTPSVSDLPLQFFFHQNLLNASHASGSTSCDMTDIGDIKVTKVFSLAPRSTPAFHTCCYNVHACRVHTPDATCMGIGQCLCVNNSSPLPGRNA